MSHGATWMLDGPALPHRLFAILAIANAMSARTELGMMHSVTVAEFGTGGDLPLRAPVSQGARVLSHSVTVAHVWTDIRNWFGVRFHNPRTTPLESKIRLQRVRNWTCEPPT